MFGQAVEQGAQANGELRHGQASAERNRQFDWIREVLCNKAPMFTIRPVRSDFAV